MKSVPATSRFRKGADATGPDLPHLRHIIEPACKLGYGLTLY